MSPRNLALGLGAYDIGKEPSDGGENLQVFKAKLSLRYPPFPRWEVAVSALITAAM